MEAAIYTSVRKMKKVNGNRHSIKTPFKKAKTFKELKTIMHSSLNGTDNIYWIKASEVLK
jgi:hypothetical protein